MGHLTVGDLLSHLSTLDPDLPVGVCHLQITATDVVVDLAGGDAPVTATNSNGEPTAVWLTTQPIEQLPILHPRRPRSWIQPRPCGCLVEIEISTPGNTTQEPCSCQATNNYWLTPDS